MLYSRFSLVIYFIHCSIYVSIPVSQFRLPPFLPWCPGLFSMWNIAVLCLVAQSCLTLCNPMDCSPPGSLVHGIPRQEYWSGLPFPSLHNMIDSQKNYTGVIKNRLESWGEQDGGGVGRCGVHLFPRIHEEYIFRHRSASRTPAESRQEYLTRGK